MGDCIVAALLAVGITAGIFLIAAILFVLAGGTAGAAVPFEAAVAAVLASWWIPIATSLLIALASAFALCTGGTVSSSPGGGAVVEGGAIGVSVSSALIAGEWKLRRRPKIPSPRL